MRLFAACALGALILGACGEGETADDNVPPLRVAFNPWPGNVPLVIAQDKVYFAEEGVEVDLRFAENVISTLSDFAAHSYDVIFHPLGGLVHVFARDPDVRVILCFDQSLGADAVVATPEIESIADLRGKRIGVVLGGFGELFVINMLEREGLTTEDVTLIHMEALQVQSGFASGIIQAGHTWEPYVSQLTSQGNHVIFDSEQTPGLISDVIAVHKSILDERPEDVRAFVRAWFRAADFWMVNPNEAEAILKRRSEFPPEMVSLEGLKLLTREENRAAFGDAQDMTSLKFVAQQYADFLVETGYLNVAPAINELFDPRFLN